MACRPAAMRMPLARTPRQAMRHTAPSQRRAPYSSQAAAREFKLGSLRDFPSVPFNIEKPTVTDVQLALDFVRNRQLVTPELGAGFPNGDPMWLPANVSLLAWPLFRCFATYDAWRVPSAFIDNDFAFYGLNNPQGKKGVHLFSSEERYNKWMTETKTDDTPDGIQSTPINGLRFMTAVSTMPDIEYIELDPGSLRIPLSASSAHFPVLKRLMMAFQNDNAIRNWKKSKKPATLMYNLGTRGPFFTLNDRSHGQFLRIQDDEALLPIFTDLYYFMKWYDALPGVEREGLELTGAGGFKIFTAALSFMDQGWATSVLLNPGTSTEHRIPRTEWREMTALMRNEAQVRAEQQMRRPIPDPALDAYELGSADTHTPTAPGSRVTIDAHLLP